MDEMYLSILNSPDKDLAKDMAIKKLQNKLMELDKVMTEAKIKRFLGSVKVQLNIKDLIASGFTTVGGYTLGTKIGFPTVGAVLGFVSSMINVTFETSLNPKEIPENLNDYAYLYYQNKEIR